METTTHSLLVSVFSQEIPLLKIDNKQTELLLWNPKKLKKKLC